MIIFNGKNAIMGRLASTSAKKLLAGEEVIVVNAEKIIITGRPLEIKAEYIAKRVIGSPQHGPFFPRSPDMILRRTIRGMLPYKTPKGRAAFKKLRVYSGVPHGMEEGETVEAKTIKSNYITLGEVAKNMGWKHR